MQIVQIQKNTVFCVSPLSTDTDTAICQVPTDVKCSMQLQTVNHMHIPLGNGCSGLTEENVHNHHMIVTTMGSSRSLRQLVGEICKTLRWKLPAELGKGLSPFKHGCSPTHAAFSVQPKTTLTARRVMAGCPWEFEWPQEPRVRSWQKQEDDLGCSDLLEGLGRNDRWKDV